MKLAERMAALGLYRLRAGGIVAGELDAYQAALALLEQKLARLEALFCPARMDRPQLKAYCGLLGYEAPARIEDGVLRHAVGALAQGNRGWTLAELERRLQTLEVRAAVREEAGAVVLYYSALQGFFDRPERLEGFVRAFVPAGVPVRLETGGPTWAQLDAADYTAAQWEEKDADWARFDADGYALLEG